MTDLVTASEARLHLRLDTEDGSPDDLWLAIFIPAISQSVLNWLKDEWRAYVPELNPDGSPVVDSNGDPIPSEDSNGPVVRPVVKAAVLLELASTFRFREGEGKDNVVTPDAGHGYVLNKASTALLTPLRKPTVS
jgi:hypothetical protein